MKKVEAIIKPSSLDEVRDALIAAGVTGMTVSEVRGYTRKTLRAEMHRGAEHTVDFLPKIRIEAVLSASRVDAAVEAIISAARTGRAGDGKIFVSDIEQVVRIRTGETGEAAT